MHCLPHRSPRLITLSGLTLAALLTAFAAYPVSAQNPPPTYPVHGVVLDSITHEPIPRALVQNNENATLTDGEGRFEMLLNEGVGSIGARRPSYSPQESEHVFNIGPNTPDITLYLTPHASITGHVTLSTGDEPENIRFTAYRRTVVQNRERWVTGGQAGTNSEGDFRMVNLSAPSFYVVCSIPTLENNGQPVAGSKNPPAFVYGYPSICYPGPVQSSANAPSTSSLSLSPGQHAEVELSLVREPFYRVIFSVPNVAPGVPVGVQIYDESGRALDYTPFWKSQLSVAEVYLPSGGYYAEGTSDSASAVYGRVDFQVAGRPVSDLVLHMLPLNPVRVEVHKDFTASASSTPNDRFGSGLTREGPDPGVNLNLSSADSTMSELGWGGLYPAKGSNDPNLFQIEHVTPGRYWVWPFSSFGYVNSITSGGVDLTREPLVVGPGGTTTPIQIYLRNDVGQISATVTPPNSSAPPSGGPRAPGEITLSYLYAFPVSRTTAILPQSQGQGSDPIVLANLAPGQYRVLAFDKPQDIDLSDPQQLARINSLGQLVNVTPGNTAAVQVDLIHASTEAAFPGEGGPE